MATIASLAIDLTANSAKMVTELKKANKNLDGFAKTAKATGTVLKAAFAVVATGAFGSLMKDSIDAADRVGKLSQRLGASTEALSELKHVADLSGVSFNTMTLGLQRMVRRVSEAAAGTGEAKKAIEELGLSARGLNSLAPEKQFEVIADALSGLTSEADRVRLAMKFFDSEGVALVQTMGKGAEGIREMRQEARALGLSLSTKDTQAAALFNDQMTRAQARLNGLAKEIAINAVSAFNTLTEAFSQSGDQAAISTPDLEGLQFVIKAIGTAAFAAWNTIKALTRGFVGFGMAIKQFDEGGFKGALHEMKIAFELMKYDISQITEGVEKLFATKPPEEFIPDKTSSLIGQVDPNVVQGVDVDPDSNPLKRILGANPEETLERLEEHLMTEEERLSRAFVHRQTMLEASKIKGLISEDRYNKIGLKLEEKHLKDLQSIRDRKNKEQQQKDLKHKHQTIAATGAFFGVMGQNSKKFAIAEAITNTWLGVSESLAAYPMPIAAIMAATHLASGMQAVNNIRSGGGGPVSASSPSPSVPGLDPGSDSFIDQALQTDEEAERSVTKTVILNIDGPGKEFVRGIVDEINEINESNVRIVI